MQAAKPTIPRMGGKRRLAKYLIPLIPQHKCYVEVFCGGAALFFLRPFTSRVEILNDINGELINLYRVVQHHPAEFVRQFQWTLSSRQVFAQLQYTNPGTLTDIQRAPRFYYLQQHAFGGKIENQCFGSSTTSTDAVWSKIEGALAAAHRRLERVTIENLPWQDCVRKYDAEHVFFYMDPPYWQSEGYDVPFDFEQYEEMAATMRTCRGKIMLSINDHPDTRRVFADLATHELDIKYALAKVGPPAESRELIITNYKQQLSGGLF